MTDLDAKALKMAANAAYDEWTKSSSTTSWQEIAGAGVTAYLAALQPPSQLGETGEPVAWIFEAATTRLYANGLGNAPTGWGGWETSISQTQPSMGEAMRNVRPLYAAIDRPGADRAGIAEGEFHKLDTPTHVFFYEQDFYVLSNFSSFNLLYSGIEFPTSEHAYHWCKFGDPPLPSMNQDQIADWRAIQNAIRFAPSAHEAFKVAEKHKAWRRRDWDDIKLDVMRNLLREKADQHEYVRRKLLATGDRVLVEDSWRDDFWGWGPNRDGQNMLGKLWMEVRAELRSLSPKESR